MNKCLALAPASLSASCPSNAPKPRTKSWHWGGTCRARVDCRMYVHFQPAAVASRLRACFPRRGLALACAEAARQGGAQQTPQNLSTVWLVHFLHYSEALGLSFGRRGKQREHRVVPSTAQFDILDETIMRPSVFFAYVQPLAWPTTTRPGVLFGFRPHFGKWALANSAWDCFAQSAVVLATVSLSKHQHKTSEFRSINISTCKHKLAFEHYNSSLLLLHPDLTFNHYLGL